MFVPKKKALKFDGDTMHVYFTDGRTLSVPLIWFPILSDATPEQRAKYEIGGGGVSLKSTKTCQLPTYSPAQIGNRREVLI